MNDRKEVDFFIMLVARGTLEPKNSYDRVLSTNDTRNTFQGQRYFLSSFRVMPS